MNSIIDTANRTYRIANVSFSVIGDHECAILSSLAGFTPFLTNLNDCRPDSHYAVYFQGPDFFLEFKQKLSDCQLLYQFTFEDDAIDCRFYRSQNTYCFTMLPSDRSVTPLLMVYQLGDNFIKASYAANATILRFALWMAFALVAAPNNAVPIHSSTIVCRNQAVLFLGESGTGKSTHTRLWLNHIPDAHLLNDDSPILYWNREIPMVSGSPWSGKTPCYHNRQFPLAAVVRLSQAPVNSIQKLPVVAAFTAIQPSCPPALAYDEHYTDWVVDLLSKVVEKTPVFHLNCLPDADAARLSYSTIFAQ